MLFRSWALRGMDDRQLLAAAQIARDNEIWDRAIATADRTVALHDFTMRYPAPHREIFAEQARARAIEAAFAHAAESTALKGVEFRSPSEIRMVD